MATFRKIHVNFWSDSYVAELTPEKKLFYIYLLTNDKTSTCGIYEITKRQMSFDTGYTVDTIDKLIEFLDNSGKIKYCKETQEICILNWKRYNDSKSPKVQSLIATELQKVKNKAFIQYISPADTVSIQYQTKSDVEVDIDIEVDIELEVEVESKNGVFENLEKDAIPAEVVNSPLSKMFNVWRTQFPNYPHDPKKDFVALRQIAEFIFKRQPAVIPIAELEKGIADFAMKVKANDFYRNKALCTISNKIQDILMQGNKTSNVAFKRSQLDSGVPQDAYASLAKTVNS
jgi:hypothetical protein